MEKTLSIVKPDGVKKRVIGEVIRRFEKDGLKITALKMVSLSKREAEGFYAVHSERPFFDSLTSFISSGPIVVMMVEGKDVIKKVRTIMGATNPEDASPGTIRRDLAGSIEENIVHGSDSKESAAFETGYFFSKLETFSY